MCSTMSQVMCLIKVCDHHLISHVISHVIKRKLEGILIHLIHQMIDHGISS